MDGYALAHGFDPLLVGLDRLCNFVWWYYTQNQSPAEVEKFRARLWRQPIGVTVIDERSPWSPENESKAFSALVTQMGSTSSKPDG